jgi:pyruvate dehydrogenase E2 component (dihydrolipoamide acetyltransferase)
VTNGGKADRHRATPVARRLAAELGVSLEGVSGTGPGGRIVRADVRDASPGPAGEDEIELTPTQRTIAQRMTESRAQIPDFTLEVEIDMEAAAEAREALQALGREPLRPSTTSSSRRWRSPAQAPGGEQLLGGGRIKRTISVNSASR